MARTAERGGPQTRAKIAQVAAQMFLERGFDDVTVAEVARAAGVSSVTVFKHFPRKEDLFLDRSEEAVELVRAAVRERPAGADVLEALRRTTERLVDERHPLSGVDPRSVPFFRTVAGSPALLARAREIAAELQGALAAELSDDRRARDGVDGPRADEGGRDRAGADDGLLAAFFVAGYATVLTGTARRLVAGESVDDLLDEHRAAFERLFSALRDGGAGHR